MKTETQDRLWSILSKEERDFFREEYRTQSENKIEKAIDGVMRRIFSHHNLTSEEEPEEVLTVSKNIVMALYLDNAKAIQDSDDERVRDHSAIINITLESLFDMDKCLPDPSEEKPTPRFKVGDIVKVKNGNYGGSIMKIHNRRLEDYGWIYDLGEKSKDIVLWFSESELEPYTEPEPQQTEDMKEKGICESLYNALGELESASVKVRQTLIQFHAKLTEK